MAFPPDQNKQKNTDKPFVREQINVGEQGCLRGVVVFIGLLVMFGVILFVMSRL